MATNYPPPSHYPQPAVETRCPSVPPVCVMSTQCLDVSLGLYWEGNQGLSKLGGRVGTLIYMVSSEGKMETVKQGSFFPQAFCVWGHARKCNRER